MGIVNRSRTISFSATGRGNRKHPCGNPKTLREPKTPGHRKTFSGNCKAAPLGTANTLGTENTLPAGTESTAGNPKHRWEPKTEFREKKTLGNRKSDSRNRKYGALFCFWSLLPVLKEYKQRSRGSPFDRSQPSHARPRSLRRNRPGSLVTRAEPPLL